MKYIEIGSEVKYKHSEIVGQVSEVIDIREGIDCLEYVCMKPNGEFFTAHISMLELVSGPALNKR